MSEIRQAGDGGKASGRSPLAGCGILVAAAVVMVLLVGFSITTLFRQYDEIVKFTSDKAAPVEVSATEEREAELNDLAERLEGFRQALHGEGGSELELSVEDLNLAIAAYAPLSELRSTFRVESISPEAMRVAISFRLNGKPRAAREGEEGWVKYDPRFLNGVLVTRPEVQREEILLRIDEIEVPGAEVPEGFIGQMSPYRPAQRYIPDPVLGPAMARVTSVELGEGKLVLRRVPGETGGNVITSEQVDEGTSRLFVFFGIGASIFLVLVGLVLFVGLRAKGRAARGP